MFIITKAAVAVGLSVFSLFGLGLNFLVACCSTRMPSLWNSCGRFNRIKAIAQVLAFGCILGCCRFWIHDIEAPFFMIGALIFLSFTALIALLADYFTILTFSLGCIKAPSGFDDWIRRPKIVYKLFAWMMAVIFVWHALTFALLVHDGFEVDDPMQNQSNFVPDLNATLSYAFYFNGPADYALQSKKLGVFLFILDVLTLRRLRFIREGKDLAETDAAAICLNRDLLLQAGNQHIIGVIPVILSHCNTVADPIMNAAILACVMFLDQLVIAMLNISELKKAIRSFLTNPESKYEDPQPPVVDIEKGLEFSADNGGFVDDLISIAGKN